MEISYEEIKKIVWKFIPNCDEKIALVWFLNSDTVVIEKLTQIIDVFNYAVQIKAPSILIQRIVFLIDSIITYSLENDGKLNPIFEKLNQLKDNGSLKQILKERKFFE